MCSMMGWGLAQKVQNRMKSELDSQGGNDLGTLLFFVALGVLLCWEFRSEREYDVMSAV